MAMLRQSRHIMLNEEQPLALRDVAPDGCAAGDRQKP